MKRLAAFACLSLAVTGLFAHLSSAQFTGSTAIAGNAVTVDKLANYFSVTPLNGAVASGDVDNLSLDFGTVASWKDAVVDQMTGGIASLFKANGVDWVKGKGQFTAPNTIAVEGGDMRSGTAAALVGAAMLSTAIFPLIAMFLRREAATAPA